MSYFKLICEDDAMPFGGASKITQEFEHDELYVILANMTRFLQSAGYLDKNNHIAMERNVDLEDLTENLFFNREHKTSVGKLNYQDPWGIKVGPADC